VRLEPLYRLSFHYPESWFVEVDYDVGIEAQQLLIAEGRAEGRIAGRMRGANHPRRRADLTFLPDFHGVIETDEGPSILFNVQGLGRPQDGHVVGFATHIVGDERYRWLNDTVCAVAGAVERGEKQTEIVLDIAELVWEPLPERPRYDSVDGN
jgi:hypothetical protein